MLTAESQNPACAEDAQFICSSLLKEERLAPCTSVIMTGLSAMAAGTVHSIGTSTISLDELRPDVIVSPAFGALILKTSLASWALVAEMYRDSKTDATEAYKYIVTGLYGCYNCREK